MKTQVAIAKAGSASELARILGITASAVSQWGEEVPRLREYELRDKHPDWFQEADPQPAA